MDLFPNYSPKSVKQKWAEQFIGEWAYHYNDDILIHLEAVLGAISYDEIKNLVYPAKEHRFRIFNDLKLNDIKVVIVGQDPYPGPKGQAIGYAFGCGKFMSPSLEKIDEAIETYCGDQEFHKDSSIELTHLVKQGVFLINTALTVRSGKIGSHKNIGWDKFIKETFRIICTSNEDIIWMLWGNDAKEYANTVHAWSNNHVLMDTHPSHAARNHESWQCPHFETANNLLLGAKKKPILWRIKK